MVQNRTHFNKTAKEIEEAIEQAKNDPNNLKSLVEEINFRKKSRKKLEPSLIKANEYLRSKSEEEKLADISPRPEKPQTPIRHSKANHKLTETEDIGTILVYKYRPKVIWRLFGARPYELHLSSSSLVVLFGALKQQIRLNKRPKMILEPKLFGTKFSIESEGKLIVFGKIGRLNSHSISYFSEFINLFESVKLAVAEHTDLFQNSNYLNERKISHWLQKHSQSQDLIERLNQTNCELCGSNANNYGAILNCRTLAHQYNNNYVLKQKIKWSKFFKTLESNPLSDRQIEGILRDDDYTLIVAGAGTGKTSVVVGKIGFIIENKDATADEILALAFARKAADEMRGRVLKQTGHKVEIRTFHSLARQIVLNAEGKVPVITDAAHDERTRHSLISRLLANMMDDAELRQKIAEFISYHRYPAKFLEDFDTKGKYLKYLRKHEPRTLRGELVKSFEELLIADWLTLHGIKYSYEHPYELETADRKRRQYKPDFHLTDYGIYLEHFGIGKDGSTAPGIDAKTYNDGIEWKRNLHQTNNTTLIETYSWERMEGSLLQGLEYKMASHSILMHPLSHSSLNELFSQRNINQKLISLLGDFLSVYKEGLWTFEEVLDLAEKSTLNKKERTTKFLDIFKPFYQSYQSHLNDRQEIDFSDLISLATNYLNQGRATLDFKRVIIDEYQDISRGRQRLINEILNQSNDVRLLCVGDDWQLIFGFTGSDIHMTTGFGDVFGNFTRVDLDKTFRFTDPILNSSSRFVQENPTQFRKHMTARPSLVNESIEIHLKDSKANLDIQKCLRSIDSARPNRIRWSVMLLGRYRFSEPKDWKIGAEKFPMLDVEFMTIHKSKGLEADAVIILDLNKGRYGFPGEIPNDPLMSLVLPNEESFEKAEERRVLYVAMTRARSKIIVVADQGNPSDFLNEIQKYDEISMMDDESTFGSFLCPQCKVGHLSLEFPNRLQGYAWRCNLHPYCDGKAKLCGSCTVSPIIEKKCVDANCTSNQQARN